eukprot:4803364-Ditylum_brightwellii.AAC.1
MKTCFSKQNNSMEPNPIEKWNLVKQDKNKVNEEKKASPMDCKIALTQTTMDNLTITTTTEQNDKKKRKALHSNNDMGTESEREHIECMNKKSMDVIENNKLMKN